MGRRKKPEIDEDSASRGRHSVPASRRRGGRRATGGAPRRAPRSSKKACVTPAAELAPRRGRPRPVRAGARRRRGGRRSRGHRRRLPGERRPVPITQPSDAPTVKRTRARCWRSPASRPGLRSPRPPGRTRRRHRPPGASPVRAPRGGFRHLPRHLRLLLLNHGAGDLPRFDRPRHETIGAICVPELSIVVCTYERHGTSPRASAQSPARREPESGSS